MKNTIALILLLITVQVSLASGNQQIKYRIQCATSADKFIADKSRKIVELKTFTLPSGSKIYFSGGYFDKYNTAKERLDAVIAAGFDKAFIRVFKYNNMLSKSVGNRYIEIALSKMILDKLNSEDTLGSSKPKPKTVKAVSSNKVYSRAEINAIKKKSAERKAKEVAKEKAIESAKQIAREKKEAEKAMIEEKKLPELVITEPPVFKVMLGKSNGVTDQFEAVNKLNSEVIYTYELRNEVIYTVGHYKNSEEANKALPSFKKVAADAKVIGFYRGKIISLKLANQLFAQYNSQNN